MRRGELSFEQVKDMPSSLDKQTPLLLSVHFSQFEIFMYLSTELKCSIEQLDARRNNVLHLALQQGHLDLIRKLIHLDSDYGMFRAQRNLAGLSAMEVGEAQY